MEVYSGSNNGMKKMSKVFRNKDVFGQVELKNIHRSRIAFIADEMK
jgi:predicted ribonuclease YlaK